MADGDTGGPPRLAQLGPDRIGAPGAHRALARNLKLALSRGELELPC